ncbi:MAG: hypothetical protein RR614_08005 [Eubacterium sp.]
MMEEKQKDRVLMSQTEDNNYPFEEEVCSAEFPQGCIDPELPQIEE